jgi:DNA-binding CsgD family transcriptional regulator/pimeloyl-ACP methyl ester carboxylesterase
MEAPPVQYVTTSDGCNIAYCVCGEGLPLVFMSPNLYDTQQMWRFFPDWLQGLAARFRLIQYDPRGEGMSSRGLSPDMTMGYYTRDLEALVKGLNLQRFVLYGFGGRAHIAVRYADAHPDQLAALVLQSPSVSGATPMPVFYRLLPKENWTLFLRSHVRPGLSEEAAAERVEEFGRTVSLEDWNTWTSVCSVSDVNAELRNLRVPSLVLQPRDFFPLPAEEPMKVAALIQGARYVLMDGRYGDAAPWLAAIDAFVDDLKSQGETGESGSAVQHTLSSREVEVLRLVAAGRSNQQIADELVISLNTVRRHVSNIFDKTGAANRADAVSYAHRKGMV